MLNIDTDLPEDLESKESKDWFIDKIKKEIETVIRRGNSILPIFIGFLTKDPTTGIQYDKPVITGFSSAEFGSHTGNPIYEKEQFAFIVKKICNKGEALGSILVFEAWSLIVTSNENIPKDLSKHPDREEIVMIVLEHVSLPRGEACYYKAKIIRKENELPVLDTWELVQQECFGRFSPCLTRNINHKCAN